MNDGAPTDAGRDRAPFAGVPARGVVRDVLAVMALLVALPMPWDATQRGSDRLEVVLVTVLAVLALVVPYGVRGGVLPPSWERFTTPRARVLGCAPYAAVAVLYLVLDVVRSSDDAGLVGGGLAVGLAGVVLGAVPRWPHGLALASAVVAALALATPVLAAFDGEPWPTIVGSVLNVLLVLGVLALTALALLRGDLVGGIVLVGVGAAVAVELVLLGGGEGRPWFESVHGERFGLLLLPVVAAFAVPRVLDGVRAVAGQPADAHAARWVAVAVRLLDLVLLVAGFVALVAVVRTVADGVAVNLVLRIVFGLLMVLVAVVARRALVRDPRSGHVTAVGAACVLVLLGLVIVVARAGVGTRSNLEELLATFALPAMVLLALLVPPAVRELVAAADAAPAAAGPQPVVPAAYDEQVPQPQQVPQQAPQQAPHAEPVDVARPAEAWQPQEAAAPPSQEQGAGHGPGVADTAPVAGWGGAWSPADQTQALPPVGRPYDARPGYEPGAGRQDADATQALPPAVDVPGSRWTAARALDPSTPLADLALIVQEAPHLRPHVAANPSTYPALLDWLGALGDPAVDAALRSRR